MQFFDDMVFLKHFLLLAFEMCLLWNKVGRTYGIPEISKPSDMELFFAITMKSKIIYLI